jgi:hypothetical protein
MTTNIKIKGNKATRINVLIDGQRQQLSFNKIAELGLKIGKPMRYNMGDKVGAFSMSNNIEDFATKFTLLFYKDFANRTFKVNMDYNGIHFYEVKSITKQMLYDLTSPTL